MGIKEEVYGLERDLYEKELDRDIDGDGTVAGVAVSDTVGNADPSDNPGAEEDEQPEIRESERGYWTKEQATEQLQEQYGINLENLEYGSLMDLSSPFNKKVFTYEDEQQGLIIEVFSRAPNHDTYFKKILAAAK
jgi:hypothetical protein